jgi:hypothetical protein
MALKCAKMSTDPPTHHPSIITNLLTHPTFFPNHNNMRYTISTETTYESHPSTSPKEYPPQLPLTVPPTAHISTSSHSVEVKPHLTSFFPHVVRPTFVREITVEDFIHDMDPFVRSGIKEIIDRHPQSPKLRSGEKVFIKNEGIFTLKDSGTSDLEWKVFRCVSTDGMEVMRVAARKQWCADEGQFTFTSLPSFSFFSFFC